MAARRQNHSELECFTLGLIWQSGPCTPYQVRKQMLDSPSTQWSGSAGSIYPLMRRLARQGLLRARPEATGRRKRQLYAITAAGIRTLQRWIGPPLADEAVTVAHDPLRSRARFLGVLPRRQQLAWITAAIDLLDEVARRVEEWEATYGQNDVYSHMIARSGTVDVQSRRQWLRDSLRTIDSRARKR